MSAPTVSDSEKLDQLIGEVRGMRGTMDSQTQSMDKLAERMAVVEAATQSTKEVVTAWSAAKTWLRWFKWIAGFLAVLASLFFTIKGGVSK
jgi:uncharacterized protein YoxC